ncbi:MAG: hypothetical protein C4B57_06795 [Deltaproteobacteria bacterium]|nr:MAG: hypothetical protein C4B57_06795 [Deltaproteobacteria bacterium]
MPWQNRAQPSLPYFEINTVVSIEPISLRTQIPFAKIFAGKTKIYIIEAVSDLVLFMRLKNGLITERRIIKYIWKYKGNAEELKSIF